MTVLVLFGVPVYIVLVYLAVQLVRRISQRRWPVVVVLVLAIAWPVGDAMWPKWVISNYCDNEGPFIREVVENVEGFYLGGSEGCDRNCFYALMDRQGNNIRFVEAHVSAKTFRNNGAPVPAKIYEKGYAPGPGLYRFTREKAGHPNCKIYDRVLARTPRDQSDLHYVENCIATWPIYEVTATYEVSRSFEVNKLSFGVLKNSSYKITRISDGKNILENNRYIYFSDLFWSSTLGSYTCKRGHVYSSFRDVLKP